MATLPHHSRCRTGCAVARRTQWTRQPETPIEQQPAAPPSAQQELHTSPRNPPLFNIARAGVSPPTTSRGKPLHPAQHQPIMA
ncbi:hypothetical protein [Kingella oralis]|uniref:hypothetical protein n=1 Tax=Kingella oralis TaxID=505 RepID=UPI002D7E6DFF|nr:hypothetical protein [Kingella oralis]